MKIWKDIYELPFSYPEYEDESIIARVYDNKGQFAFECIGLKPETKKRLISIINKEEHSNKILKCKYDKTKQRISTEIAGKTVNFIRIRGWGNLIGTGGHNLKQEEAANVQDTLGEYIVNMLNG